MLIYVIEYEILNGNCFHIVFSLQALGEFLLSRIYSFVLSLGGHQTQVKLIVGFIVLIVFSRIDT